MIIKTGTVFSIVITICIGENVIFPEKYNHFELDRAIGTVNRHQSQYEMSSTYKHSVVHLNSSPKSTSTVNMNQYNSNPTNIQIQYAPLMKPGEVTLHRGKYTKLSAGNYLSNGAINIIKGEIGNTISTEHPRKKPLEPRIEPENLYTRKNDHPQPLKYIDYVPGHNIEVMRSMDRYPGHNAIYNNSPNEKQNRVSSQYYPKDPEPKKNDRYLHWNSVSTSDPSLAPPQSSTTTTTRRPISSPPFDTRTAGQNNQYYIGKPTYVQPPPLQMNPNPPPKPPRTIKITKMHSIYLNVARNYNQGVPTLDTREKQLSRLLYGAPGGNTKLYPRQRNHRRFAYDFK